MLVSDSADNIQPGDMVVFEETGEVCVLIELFDVTRNFPPREDDHPRTPKLAWNAIWQTKPKEGQARRRGPFQRYLEPDQLKHVKKYGISKVNLFNCLSNRRATKEGNIITVPKKTG